MDLEGFMLSKINQRKPILYITYIWNLKKCNKLVNITKKNHVYNTSANQLGEGRGRVTHVQGIKRYKLLGIK